MQRGRLASFGLMSTVEIILNLSGGVTFRVRPLPLAAFFHEYVRSIVLQLPSRSHNVPSP